uniref:hypothetical protein Ycf1 n=1 Tax=Halophila ovalis TaxID=62339 RepID=UPI00226CEBC0|nr:hypothetical protein Ycf1 [Halophila ovalis]YP_010574402.1 hypothetical protein Ycf1 [Halophila ovalis]UZH94408.1 hypothetical protein Ycf1 [Halophila ovalis]UZH94413.1 hypothetical protein Ycf1 [Halophila ovalis]
MKRSPVETIRRFSTAYGFNFVFMSIMNSVWTLGLYYGFISTVSMGPCYILFIRIWILEKESNKKKNFTAAAVTGFVTGQFMTVLAIYYAPLHRAFQGPHKVAVVIPATIFIWFMRTNLGSTLHPYFEHRSGSPFRLIRNRPINFPDDESIIMRKFGTPCIFLNSMLIPILNYFVVPSSIPGRLVDVYMFRCDNKIAFVTGSFFGWILGNLLVIQLIRLIWNWIPSKKYKHLVVEFTYSGAKIWNIFLLITVMVYWGRMPFPVLTHQLIPQEEERERRGKHLSGIDPKERKEKKRAKKISAEWLEWEKRFEKQPLLTFFFDYRRWTRPLRYIKNHEFEQAVRNRMTQYFFDACPSDGKQRICFTYPPSLSIWREIIEKSLSTFSERREQEMSLDTTEKRSHENKDPYQNWVSTNEQKRQNLSNEFMDRIKALGKQEGFLDVLEKRMRLYIDEREGGYLPEQYDPLLNGPYRGDSCLRKGNFPTSTRGSTENSTLRRRNPIHSLLLNELEDQKNEFVDSVDEESLSTHIGHSRTPISPIREFSSEYPTPTHMKHFASSTEEEGIDSENEEEIDSENEEEIDSENEEETEEREEIHEKRKKREEIDEKLAEREEIRKEVPRWSYKLIAEWELDANDIEEEATQTEEEEKEGKRKKDNEDEQDEQAQREYYYDIRLKKGRLFPIYNTQLEMKLLQKEKEEKEAKENENENEKKWERFMKERANKEAANSDETEAFKKEQKPSWFEKVLDRKSPFPWVRKKVKEEEAFEFEEEQEEEDEEEKEQQEEEDEGEDINVVRYSHRPSFRRGLIKGSMRNQRRKTGSWRMTQVTKRSAFCLCLDNIKKQTLSSLLSFDFSKIKNLLRFIKNSTMEEAAKSYLKRQVKPERIVELDCIERAERWDRINMGQTVRSLALLFHSFVRKYIKLPLLIIAKNIGRMLLLQMPELIEDWEDWKREMHVLCTYTGIELSETEFPKDFLNAGLQIKIVFPFHLKPWQGVQFYYRSEAEQKNSEANHCFLTFVGTEARVPFDKARVMPSFFKPIFEELKRRYRKVKEKCFEFLVKLVKFLILKVLNVNWDWVPKTVEFIIEGIKKSRKVIKKVIIKGIEKIGIIQGLPFNFKNKKKKSVENETNSIITNKENTQESIIPIPSSKNYLKEMKMKELIDRTITIRNQIEEIKKERNKIIPIPDLNRISPNKTDFHDQKSKLWKHLWLRSKKRKTRFIRKFNCFRKLFMEGIYTDLFLYIIHMVRMNVQLFVQSIHKKINQEGADSAGEIERPFLFIIEKWENRWKNILRSKDSNPYWDLSSLSQAYVFYKISQAPISNRYHLRSVLQYNGTDLFLKDSIKKYLETQGIGIGIKRDQSGWWKSWWPFKHKQREKQREESRIWKSWLKSRSQYNVSKTKWSKLEPERWREEASQKWQRQKKASQKWQRQSKARYFCPIENENSMNCNSYTNFYQKEKDPSLPYGKQKDYEAMKNKEKWKKSYRYDLLLQKYINCEDLSISKLPLSDSYRFHTQKPNVLMDIDLSDYLTTTYNKNRKTKYFHCEVFDLLDLYKDTESFTPMDIEIMEKGMKEKGSRNKKYNKNLLSPSPVTHRIQQKLGNLYKEKGMSAFEYFLIRYLGDWMGMNYQRISRPMPNSEYPFLSKLGFGVFDETYHAYNTNPCAIPTQLLFAEDSELDKQNQKKQDRKTDSTKSKSKILEKLESKILEKLESETSETYKNPIEQTRKDLDFPDGLVGEVGELVLLVRRYSLVQIKTLDSRFFPDSSKNLKILCHLLRLGKNNPKFSRMAYAAVRNKEFLMSKVRDDDDVKEDNRPLIQRIIGGRQKWDLQPLRAFSDWDKTLIMYQMISLSLLDKNKHQMTKKFIKEKYVDKKDLEKSIDSNLFGNENNNNYDFLFLVPEHILSTRHRRKLRILMCFHSRSQNVENGISNENDVKNYKQFRNEDEYTRNEDEYTDTNPLRKFKLFLWPNYRLEDLACMNRYWFHTNNGSRFTMLRIRMYPRSK